jgi:hypothetical protein
MHSDSDLDFQRATRPCELSESDKKRLIANCEARWKRTKMLAAILRGGTLDFRNRRLVGYHKPVPAEFISIAAV